MSHINVEEHARGLHERLPDDVDVTVEELQDGLSQFYEFDLDGKEAERPVLRQVANKHGIDEQELFATVLSDGSSQSNEFEDVDITDINDLDADEFITIEAQVAELWDDDTDSIQQVGLLQDNTGRIKFKSWSTSNPPMLNEGDSYRLEGVATDEYQGNMSVSINSQTEMEFSDETFESPEPDDEVLEGYAIVDLQNGEGLVKRCPECSRVINGECDEHGSVSHDFDLRLKGTIDNGEETFTFVMNREVIEDISDMTLDKAKELAKETLDQGSVLKELKDEMVPSYWTFEGFHGDTVFVVKDSYKTDSNGIAQNARNRLQQIDADSFINNGDLQ